MEPPLTLGELKLHYHYWCLIQEAPVQVCSIQKIGKDLFVEIKYFSNGEYRTNEVKDYQLCPFGRTNEMQRLGI